MKSVSRKFVFSVIVGVATATVPMVAVGAQHAVAETAVQPEVASLMSQSKMSASQATAFLAAQASSYDVASTLESSQNIDSDNLAIDQSTGNLLGYYATPSEKTAILGAGVTPVQVPYSAETLSTIMDSITDAIPTSDDGFHSTALNVASGTIDVYGTTEFFASTDWQTASINKPVTTHVETGPNTAVPATAGKPVPGVWTVTPGQGVNWICSAGWVTQQAWMITAGHCTFNPFESGGINALGRTVSDATGTAFGTTSNSAYQTNGVDYGRIKMYSGAAAEGTGYYANYNGGNNRIYSVTRPIKGSYVCKYGTTTHATCGTLTYKVTQNYGTARGIHDLWESPQFKIRGGDSGGPVAVYRDSTSGIAVGIVSGYNGDTGYISILDDALKNYGATLNTATGSKS